MEKQARTVLLGTAVLLSCMLAWAWSSRPAIAVPVQVTGATTQDIYNSISVPGTIESESSASYTPERTAVVRAVLTSVGESVEKGQALFTLALADDMKLDASSLQSMLDTLSGDSGKTVTVEANGTVAAQEKGTVLSLPVVGQTVYPGVACAQVADLSRLRARVNIPESYIGQVASGMNVNVTATAVPDEVYGGYVQSVAPVAVRAVSLTGDKGAASIEAVLPLQSGAEKLRPGYTVTAKIFTDKRKDAVVIPYAAVRQQGEQEYVFVVENGTAHRRDIETGYMLETVTEVREGLTANDVVVISPEVALADGDPVEAIA